MLNRLDARIEISVWGEKPVPTGFIKNRKIGNIGQKPVQIQILNLPTSKIGFD
jgi:hypothetical protein